jgi:hypothetical protein
MSAWPACWGARADLLGQSWLTLVPRGSRLIYHSCVASMLVQQGQVEEVSLPWLAADGSAADTLVNASRVTCEGRSVVCMAVFRVRERRQLEEQLLHAKRAAEQWRETHATPQREPDGGLLWHGYTSDITERKTLGRPSRTAWPPSAPARPRAPSWPGSATSCARR